MARPPFTGVAIKWFGAADPVGSNSTHRSWRYMAAQRLPRTDRILSGLFDMRLPLTFSLEDCGLVAGQILGGVSGLELGGAA